MAFARGSPAEDAVGRLSGQLARLRLLPGLLRLLLRRARARFAALALPAALGGPALRRLRRRSRGLLSGGLAGAAPLWPPALRGLRRRSDSRLRLPRRGLTPADVLVARRARRLRALLADPPAERRALGHGPRLRALARHDLRGRHRRRYGLGSAPRIGAIAAAR